MKTFYICIIGLGNVGLDLAINFSKNYKTIGYDKDKGLIKRIKVQKKWYVKKRHQHKKGLIVTSNTKLITDCNVYIITVPTSVDKKNLPDLKNIIDVTRLISEKLKAGDIVIYESTFYPGLTEEICIPIIEKESKLKLNKDFFVGYSPERINIGENKKMSNDITKITSGSNPKASKIIDNLYNSVICAGTHNVESIKIAEAVKMLENCQRDLNIALMNELHRYFNKLKIDTKKVIHAASTKWNFAEFYPGLVGGECIAVDPYYILHAAKKTNHKLPLIKLGRKINEEMVDYIYNNIIKKFSPKKNLRLAFFGISYKKNCNQASNSMYLKIAQKLDKLYSVDIYDHLVEKVNKKLNLISMEKFNNTKYDAIIIGSNHKKYEKMNFKNIKNKSTIIIDIHGVSSYSKYSIL